MFVVDFLAFTHFCRTKLYELMVVIVVDLHHARLVPASVTIVRR